MRVKSDRKLKDNITTFDFYKDLIMDLRPVTFMWKDGDHRRKRMGFIAQDVAETCKNIKENLSLVSASYIPEQKCDATDNTYFGENVDDESLTWSMSTEELIAPLVSLIQEHENRIKKLESENVLLKNMISNQ